VWTAFATIWPSSLIPRRCDARADRAPALRRIEGDDTFEGRQRFFDIVARLASERRLGRFVYLAERPI
jgi:hypothetical protein